MQSHHFCSPSISIQMLTKFHSWQSSVLPRTTQGLQSGPLTLQCRLSFSWLPPSNHVPSELTLSMFSSAAVNISLSLALWPFPAMSTLQISRALPCQKWSQVAPGATPLLHCQAGPVSTRALPCFLHFSLGITDEEPLNYHLLTDT